MKNTASQIPCNPPDCIRDRMEKVTFESWQTVRDQGTVPDHFYLTGQGVIGEFRILNNSKEILVSKQTNGHCFDRNQLENDTKSSTSLVSLSDTIMYRGDSDDLKYCRDHPVKLGDWNKQLRRPRHDYHQKIDQLLTLELKERLAIELLELAFLLGVEDGNVVELSIPMSRKKISNILGCTNETVSRIVSQWTDEGIINTERKIIRILRTQTLMSKTPENYRSEQFLKQAV